GLRQTMRDAGSRLVDGWGAERTAANLAALRSADAISLIGRRLKPSDADAIFGWQTSPGTRAFSRQPEAPSWAGHLDWINGRLRSRGSITEIILADGRQAAMARLDPIEGGLEISIVVAPEYRGKGIGEAAVRYLDVFAGEKLTS